jgi:CheY-like chemotaxis protein
LGIARAEDGRLAFEVSDTGIGIEPEALSEIFEAFTQTKDGAAAGGTGLGLTISLHLLRRMGTELHVESVPGAGSRFFFSLPLTPAGDDAAITAEMAFGPPALDARLAPGQHITALVVDDSTVSRRILASLLESAGFHVITATGGLEGIELARRHRPDVILMDVKMADVDGFAATRRLSQDEKTARIPVIAVTASALGDTRQQAKDAGCVEYLPKPVRAEALFAALQAHLGAKFVHTHEDTGPPDVRLRDRTRETQIAARLLEAVAIGNVSALETIAAELVGGDAAEAALGQRLAGLVTNFDFEGVRAVATALAGARDGVRQEVQPGD